MGTSFKADSYTVKEDNTDLVELLKSGCGSARNIKDIAKANDLRSPYIVNKGKILQIPCKLQCNINK